MLSGAVVSTYCFVSVSNHCFTCVLTTADTSASSPTTMHKASNACPKVMVNGFAPSFASRCQVRSEVRVSTPLFISVMFTASISPT
ncbi:hypothetical protein D3C83_01560 [compost metagenome]